MSFRKAIKEILQTPDVIDLDVQDIIDEVKKIVPKKINSKAIDAMGFNDCHDQIMKELK